MARFSTPSEVSILILMDLPFLLKKAMNSKIFTVSFNPYSNGSSFFILKGIVKTLKISKCFNPYSNGSSFGMSTL